MRLSLPLFFLFMTIVASLPSIAHTSEADPNYDLNVTISPDENKITGNAKITITGNRPTSIFLDGLNVISIKNNGIPFPAGTIPGKLDILSGGVIDISYSAYFTNSQEDSIKDKPQSENIISKNEIFLVDNWYPRVDGLANYKLKAILPKDFTAVSEADEIITLPKEDHTENSFVFNHSILRITLAAGRYSHIEDKSSGRNIYCYFTNDDEAAPLYIEYAKKYITAYEKLLGPYPFSRFSIIKNEFSNIYSRPAYMILGRDTLNPPVDPETAIARETLRQWLGNSVYADLEKGNWSEGLVSYLSGTILGGKKSDDWIHRKNIIISYMDYMENTDNKICLSSLKKITDPVSFSVGHGKGSMFFHMLKTQVGEDNFIKALRTVCSDQKFKTIAWDQIKEAFEQTSGKKLDIFFRQWLERTDLPFLVVTDYKTSYINGDPEISFNIVQHNSSDPYEIDIKARIETDHGDIVKDLHVSKKTENFRFTLKDNPIMLVLDPDYDVMRDLYPNEHPMALSRLFGDKDRLMVVPEENNIIFSDFINILKQEGFTSKTADQIKDQDIKKSSLLFLDESNSVYKRLFGVKSMVDQTPKDEYRVYMKKNPLNLSKPVAVVRCSEKTQADDLSKKLFHYKKYSKLTFVNGKNIEKILDASNQGIKINLKHNVMGIKPATPISLNDIIDSIIEKPVIYIGESHTNYEDHRVQLDVIRRMHAAGRKFGIGMEMFQTPFQKQIDDYIDGKTTEKEFLKGTHYYTRWKFDYNLYKEIIDFAKANHIQVIALNTDADITNKVSKQSFDSLSDEDRKNIPADMDMSNEQYMKRLKKVLSFHDLPNGGNFENFYQSQVLWDETMAHTADNFLKKNPDSQLVVLAGIGHIMYGHGIPDRTYRLNNKEHAILINSNIDDVSEGIADYILFPDHLEAPATPQMGISLSDTDKGIKIEEVQPESPAEKAGIKKNDIFIRLDDENTPEIEDLKIAFFYKKPGDIVKIKVSRERFLLGPKEITLNLTVK